MGHYLSDFEEFGPDEWNYQYVNTLGFAGVYVQSHRTSVLRCPECFCLVEGKYAQAHWEKLHAEV